ncbi:MAG: helix-turn-helix transcriptional regulator [Ruthenibacterium sp.]
MESRFEQQLKRGVLEMLVLGIVCEKDTYGYELLLALSQRSGGMLQLKEGTLYPILYRLEDGGLVVTQWRAGEENRAAPKKYYTITQAGRAALREERTAWQRFSVCVNKFCGEETQ